MNTELTTFDFETRSRVNIKTEGLARYAHDPSTSVLCAAYILPGETSPIIWTPNDPIPDFRNAVLGAWNASFERQIWQHVLKWPEPKGWYDIAAHSRYAGAPGKLQTASEWFGLGDKGKSARGEFLIKTLCIPLVTGFKKHKVNKGDFCNDPTLLNELYDYCKQDCVAEKTILELLPPWPQLEQDIWKMTLDQNERGCPIDVDLCNAVVTLTEQMLSKAQDIIFDATGGKVVSPTQTAAVKTWLNTQGVNVNDVNKETVAQIVKQYEDAKDTKNPIFQVLKARQVGAPASIKKFRSALGKHVGGRLYHQFIYCGGGATGRWSGGGKDEDSDSVQLQNLRRGKQSEEMLDVIKMADADILSAVSADPIKELQNSVRSLLYSAV